MTLIRKGDRIYALKYVVAPESPEFAAQQRLVQQTLQREEGCSLLRGCCESDSSDDCLLRPFRETLGLMKMPLEQDAALRDVKHGAELLFQD